MVDYRPLEELKASRGLRLVIVRGMPSPWAQGAKTLFEQKGLEFILGGLDVGERNEGLHAWSGTNSAPIVAWADEEPINRWNDIVLLADRLEPNKLTIPTDAATRVQFFGLMNEICGEKGIGWNRRLQMFAPMMRGGHVPEGTQRMSVKYGYREEDVAAAQAQIVGALQVLGTQLRSQYERGVKFFVGEKITALDIYWVVFMNFFAPLPPVQCPMPEQWRPSFAVTDPEILEALDPILVEHRDRIFGENFRNPMEF